MYLPMELVLPTCSACSSRSAHCVRIISRSIITILLCRDESIISIRHLHLIPFYALYAVHLIIYNVVFPLKLNNRPTN
jgi:hypothetical protein